LFPASVKIIRSESYSTSWLISLTSIDAILLSRIDTTPTLERLWNSQIRPRSSVRAVAPTNGSLFQAVAFRGEESDTIPAPTTRRANLTGSRNRVS